MAVDDLKTDIERRSGVCGDGEEQQIDEEEADEGDLKDSSSVSRSLSLTLSALVAVGKKVIEWSRSRIEEDGDFETEPCRGSPSNLMLLLTDRRVLLMRALVSCSIQVKCIDNNPDNMTSTGVLTVSTAKLLKELLLIIEASEMTYLNTSSDNLQADTTTEMKNVSKNMEYMEKIVSRLPFMLPERMLYLCRHLTSAAFCAVFNSKVQAQYHR